ncbi:hypothetical protein T11_17911 [Trichinella zimbabwensis]|uniref:Uncharacterized protein n=1 Tax=Trichinella zimbabwensis TaxID=268475 RepID=A0A0V1HXC9_9BILA|nr:hypothetical protein T11_17911 [Trichinella zimbabwensis]
MDGTKQMKRKQEACWASDVSKGENADDTKQIEDDTKQIADDTKQIEDDTKQNCGMKTYDMASDEKIKSIRGRHEADRGRHEAELWNEDIRYMWFPMDPNSVSLG